MAEAPTTDSPLTLLSTTQHIHVVPKIESDIDSRILKTDPHQQHEALGTDGAVTREPSQRHAKRLVEVYGNRQSEGVAGAAGWGWVGLHVGVLPLLPIALAIGWIALPQGTNVAQTFSLKGGTIGLMLGTTTSLFVSNIYVEKSSGATMSACKMLPVLEAVFFPLFLYLFYTMDNDKVEAQHYAFAGLLTHFCTTLMYGVYFHWRFADRYVVREALNMEDRRLLTELPRIRRLPSQSHLNMYRHEHHYTRTSGNVDLERVHVHESGVPFSAFTLKPYFGTSAGITVIIGQLALALAYPSLFAFASGLAYQLFLCTVYPLFIVGFKTVAKRVSHAHPRIQYLMESWSLWAAAIPYRVLFLQIMDWPTFVGIMVVAFSYKACAYPVRISQAYIAQRKSLVASIDALMQRVPSWEAIRHQCCLCMGPGAETIGILPAAGAGNRNTDTDTNKNSNNASSNPSSPVLATRGQQQQQQQQPQLLSALQEAEKELDRVHVKDVAHKFFLHMLADTWASVGLLLALLYVRAWDESSTIVQTYTHDEWVGVSIRYGICTLVELSILIVTMWVARHFLREGAFQPAQASSPIISDNLLMHIFIPLSTYILTFLLIVDNQMSAGGHT